ncbi:MAG: thioredoxin domain-containing protein [Chlamydiota bacterium]
MEPRKVLVLATAFAAFLIFSGGAAYQFFREPNSVVIETKGYPTLGKARAKVEIVVIEDFRCYHCREFSKKVFPQIRERYIDPGKARYTVVPVAFLPGSKPIANAALEVNKRAPDRFFLYLHEIFLHSQEKAISEKKLLEMAQKVGGIDLVQLKACMETHCHYDELNKNLEWAKSITEKNFVTPAVYVNGIPTSSLSFPAIQERIDQILKEKS